MDLLQGLIAATFTPFKPDGSLALGRIPTIVDHLVRDGVSGMYVLGSTGEGVSLTTEEREAAARAFVEAAAGRLRVVVQIGHNSLTEARRLAAHAQKIGADAISATPPEYFKPASLDILIASMAEITKGAPDLPFYYYHIPVMTGVALDMVEFLRRGSEQLPTLAGLKFSDRKLEEMQACLRLENGRFNIVFGVDETLLAGLAIGVRGAVGSTYNFAAPLYRRIIGHFEAGRLAEAAQEQARSAAMVAAIFRHCGRGGLKAMMQVIGVDCGPHRLPIETASSAAIDALAAELDSIGFFEWGRSLEPTPAGNYGRTF